jgi:hypothetical protein
MSRARLPAPEASVKQNSAAGSLRYTRDIAAVRGAAEATALALLPLAAELAAHRRSLKQSGDARAVWLWRFCATICDPDRSRDLD